MIPIDVGHRRSEATLGVDIVTEVDNIVNRQHHPPSFRGVQGGREVGND